jgi:shikimate dehydrogenase
MTGYFGRNNMFEVNTDTKLVGLLGHPLGHSYSPYMQNKAFGVMGLNYLYIPVDVLADDLGDVVRGISKMNFIGFNVTIPHKIAVMDYLDRVDDLALAIGAVNTVVVKDRQLFGYNTDGAGFIKSLADQAGVSPGGRTAFILGSGGAARAISMSLAWAGICKIYICNRTYQKAEGLAQDINNQITGCAHPVPMEPGLMREALQDADLVINATSLGMSPGQDSPAIDPALLNRRMVVCDIVYNPLSTELLREAGRIGCKTVNGLGMLAYQGALAFKLWTGTEPPAGEMYRWLLALAKNR